MRLALFLLVVLPLAYLGAVYVASEHGGEVVVLRTWDDGGQAYETHLWVVEDGGRWYLRAGRGDSFWVDRLESNPEVELVRGGETRRLRAEPAPDRTARVNQLMAEKYGVADWIISWMRDEEDSLAVRLTPIMGR